MRTLPLLACIATFGAGVVAAPFVHELLPGAHAQAAPLAPAMIDVAGIKEADLPTTPNPDLRSKTFVVTEHGTIAVQMGNVAKHFHSAADEIQFIVEGTGTAWLGDRQVEIRPGMLLVIPRGTHHAGTVQTSGRFKAIAIKLPPQAPTDTTFVN